MPWLQRAPNPWPKFRRRRVYDNLVGAGTLERVTVSGERQDLLSVNFQDTSATAVVNLLQSKFHLSHLDLLAGFVVSGNKNAINLQAKLVNIGHGKQKRTSSCRCKIFVSASNGRLRMPERFAPSAAVQAAFFGDVNIRCPRPSYVLQEDLLHRQDLVYVCCLQPVRSWPGP